MWALIVSSNGPTKSTTGLGSKENGCSTMRSKQMANGKSREHKIMWTITSALEKSLLVRKFSRYSITRQEAYEGASTAMIV